MGKLAKILLIVIPVVFFLNFLTLANTRVTRSPFLQKIGTWIGVISIFSFILLVIYFILKRFIGLFHPREKKIDEPPKENNRSFNLIWLFLFTLFIAPNFFYSKSPNDPYGALQYVFLAVGLLVFLLIIIPRRNNFFTLPLFLIISLLVNFALTRFYDLTWYFYPSFHIIAAKGGIADSWVATSSWGISFLTVMTCVYVFLSSFIRLIFKKTGALICFFIALFLTGLTSYLLFYYLPVTFTFPKTEIREEINPTVRLELLDKPNPINAKSITSVQSATSFFIYASNLQKEKRYGVKILTPEKKMRQKNSVFQYCQGQNCELNFGGVNHISDRFKPGVYTIQIIAQEENEMTIAAKSEIEITAVTIKAYDKTADYPCKMWLTLGDSNKKLMRIDIANNQEMTDIKVFAQCQKGKAYNAQITVGTISNETQYFQSMIDPAGEPVRIVSLGGNVTNGLVQLIIDNQTMGKAIINRGFPICDGEKIVEGGEDLNCQKKN